MLFTGAIAGCKFFENRISRIDIFQPFVFADQGVKVSSYRFFNIKVLPISGKRDALIGNAGYRTVFESLQVRIREAHINRDLLSVSYPLRNDYYYSVLHIKAEPPYAYGKFLKFDKPASLVDTLSGDTLQSIPKNASAHRYEFRFVFDYTRHVIAIQQISGKSPNLFKIKDALNFIFKPVISEKFPEYYLEIDLLTSDLELNKVFENAEKFKRAEVKITLTNTDEYLEDEVQETEEEMHENNISSIVHVESGPKGGFMTGLSIRCIAYLKLAKKNGEASIRYIEKQTGKVKSFVMRNHPLQSRIVMPRNVAEHLYLDRVHQAVIDADNQSRV